MGPRGSCTFVGSLDVDLDDKIPIGIGHVLEADVP